MDLFLDIAKDLIFNHIPLIFRQLFVFLFSGYNAVVDYRRKLFAKLLLGFPLLYNEKVRVYKGRLFEKLTDNEVKSADEELKKLNQVRILEIGIGEGANFKYYPEKCRLIAVDPNKYFKESLDKNLESYPGITLEKCVVGFGENLKEIPSESIDVVITTLVTCSVYDLDKFMSEIRRVLVPNGLYFFMEHVCYKYGDWKFVLQQYLNLTRVWSLLFDGCSFQPRDEMRNACNKYLQDLQGEEFYINTSGLWVFHLLSPHVAGVARK